MAFNSRILHAPPSVVWDVVIDPETYPDWLVGAADIRKVDGTWPAIGSRFHHRVGWGPLSIPDHTVIADVVDEHLLQLVVRARPFISAVSTIRLVGDASTTVVTLEEEPNFRVMGNIVRPLMDPVMHMRNHHSLRRLEQVVGDRMAAGTRV